MCEVGRSFRVPRSGTRPHGCRRSPGPTLRTVSWRASSIGRVTNHKGPLSFKAFVRGDISSLSPCRLASFSTLSRCGAQLNVGVMSTPRYLGSVWGCRNGMDALVEEERGQGALFETLSMSWAWFPSSTSR
ncbi:hypothetical protein WJX77_010635 [Trebouxia sp. C0004]